MSHAAPAGFYVVKGDFNFGSFHLNDDLATGSAAYHLADETVNTALTYQGEWTSGTNDATMQLSFYSEPKRNGRILVWFFSAPDAGSTAQVFYRYTDDTGNPPHHFGPADYSPSPPRFPDVSGLDGMIKDLK